MHPVIADPAGWPEIFCTVLASRQHRAISPARRADRSSPGLHPRHFDDFSAGVVSVVHTPACFPLSKYPRPHFAAAADRHSETRRRLRPWPSVPRPIRKTRRPDGRVDSGVAENTPGNKLSCSALNLFPSGTHTSVLGNCLSSSTATPPSEHTPLRRRCCSEPFFDFHRHGTEADRPRPIASFLKEAPLSPGGASAFSALRSGCRNSERAERRIFNQIQCNVQDDGMLLTATCS
jgi:hypothetical protein